MQIKNIFNKIVGRGPITISLAVILSVLLVTGIVSAATTISTNITTGGTLSVTGLSSLLGQASTTVFSANSAEFGASATTTITSAGRIGVASTSPYVALGVTGTTTASLGMVIGGNGSGITQLEFGSCTLTLGNIAASTTLSAICTGSEAVNGTGWRVFVTPNITEGRDIIFSSASSTADGIQVTLMNENVTGAGTINPTDNVWSWMAVK